MSVWVKKKKKSVYTVTVAPKDLSVALVVFATCWSRQHEPLSAFSCYLLVCVSLDEQSSPLSSRCEWLVAVGCCEWARFCVQPPWLTGRSREESRHQCPGDLRPGSPYEALLKGQGGFWGNPALPDAFSFPPFTLSYSVSDTPLSLLPQNTHTFCTLHTCTCCFLILFCNCIALLLCKHHCRYARQQRME